MMRPLALLLAVGIAGCATQDQTTGEAPATPRIVAQATLTMSPAEGTGGRTFGAGPAQGRLADSGDWTTRVEVPHRGLRCATYETGFQIGRGNSQCAQVDWLTEVQYATRQTQCNGATRIHGGAGTLALPPQVLRGANCARILTRCTGAC